MRLRFIVLIFLLGLCLLAPACSPGVHVRMDSSAPERSPVFLGMKRHEVEMHLGEPIFISRLDENIYRGIYEYESKLGAIDTMWLDVMDFTTLGLGNLIITPVDRLKPRNHLIAVIYQIGDEFLNNDVVIDIKENIKVSMKN